MLRGARHQARAKKKISFGINVILAVQSYLEKYSASRLTQITSISAPVPPHGGAYHDRHGRGVGCGGRGSIFARDGIAGRVFIDL
jgi:hypothetical protein